MALTEEFFVGSDGTNGNRNFPFTITYIKKADIKVSVNDVATTEFIILNDTIVQFNEDAAPANDAIIRIFRDTDIDDLSATFASGSSIRAKDLNDNFLQNNFAVQEIKNNTWDSEVDTIHSDETWDSSDTKIATTAAMDQRFQDEANETITSEETWVSDDDHVATTAALDARFQDEISDTIRSDETWVENDDTVPTTLAASTQYDTIVQTGTPSGSNFPVGKTWLENDDDRTLYIWSGSNWITVSQGGGFTSLNKVIYVDSVNGNDTNTGHRISAPKASIGAALDDINADDDFGDGSVIIVTPGIYSEEFPLDIQRNDVSIVGTSLRNCIIHPAIGVTAATAAVNGQEYRIRFVGTTDFTAIGAADNDIGTTFTATGAGTGTGTLEHIATQTNYDVDTPEANELQTMFRVNSGSYIANLTLMGMKASGARGGNADDDDATFGLPTNQGWNFAFFPDANIRKSPYIQNCTNFSDSRINNVNFTPHTPGQGAAGDTTSDPSGGGIFIDGNAVADNSALRSMVCDSYTHTALDGPGIFVTNNGYCQATSSYSFFNHYHLKCLNGGQANLAASTTDFGRFALIADGRSTTNIFTADCTVAVDTSGDAVTTIQVSNGNDTGTTWHGTSTRPQPNMLLSVNADAEVYPILSSVPEDQATYDLDPDAYTGDWIVTISRPNPNNRSENLGFSADVATGTDNVQFWLRSMIASSGHTMEYVGSGTNYSALPENGGVPVEANQKTERNNGAIWAAITDHNGKFTVGDVFEVDQQLGFVTIPTGAIAFDLQSDVTPQLGGNLDVNGNEITSNSNGDIVINPDGTGNIELGAAVGIGVNNPGSADLAIVHPRTAGGEFARFSVGQDTDGSGVDHLGVWYGRNNTAQADVFTSDGDLNFWVDGSIGADSTSSFTFGERFTNNWMTIQSHYMLVPRGTTDERPGEAGEPAAVNGQLRYNSTNDEFEGFADNQWGPLGGGGGGGATGGNTDAIFHENGQTVTANYTVGTTFGATGACNAMSAGPITINNDVTVTINDGSRWVII